jgi:hypothetical protein
MKKIIFGVVAVILISELTSCASILGSGKVLNLESVPSDVTATITDSKGNVIVTTTVPREVTLPKAGNYDVKFSKTDFIPQKVSVRKKFNHSYWLNFFAAGIGVSTHIFVYPYNEFGFNAYKIAGYGIGAIGLIGIFLDIFNGSLVGITPETVNVNLKLTPETLAAQAAAREAEEKAKAEERAKIQAEREAKEEAERQARELANRYDPSNFTVVPSNFKPANYTKADLFDAVSNSRNLQIVSNKQEAILSQMNPYTILGSLFGFYYVLEYVSDLTFVRQDGVDITFTSDDKTITQTMTIDQRSGLQAGQKVRVYYMITKSPLTTWDIIAIERR